MSMHIITVNQRKTTFDIPKEIVKRFILLKANGDSRLTVETLHGKRRMEKTFEGFRTVVVA